MKITEFTARKANVGIVDVAVNLITDPPLRHVFEPGNLCQPAEIFKRRIAIERQSFVFPESFHQNANFVKKTWIPKNR